MSALLSVAIPLLVVLIAVTFMLVVLRRRKEPK